MFWNKNKFESLRDEAQKAANKSGKVYQITEFGRVIAEIYPDKKSEPNYPASYYMTEEERIAEEKRRMDVLVSFVQSRKNAEINKKKKEGLIPCPNCQPCNVCNGKKWVQDIDKSEKR